MRVLVFVFALLGGPAAADAVDDVMAAAQARFAKMPSLVMVDQIAGQCGADDGVHLGVAYCTSKRQILMTEAARATPQAPYLVAHLLGHAIQVRHGVADVALATIRGDRRQEPLYRQNVEQMVDCIAGLLVFQAGLGPSNLTVWFDGDPFDGPHWGRNPLSEGPVVTLPLGMRNDWYRRGQGGYLAACATKVFPVDLLLEAYQD